MIYSATQAKAIAMFSVSITTEQFQLEKYSSSKIVIIIIWDVKVISLFLSLDILLMTHGEILRNRRVLLICLKEIKIIITLLSTDLCLPPNVFSHIKPNHVVLMKAIAMQINL